MRPIGTRRSQGQRYHFVVHATNGAGGITSAVTDGVSLDRLPPNIASANDGPWWEGRQRSAQGNGTALWGFFWATDAASPVVCAVLFPEARPDVWQDLGPVQHFEVAVCVPPRSGCAVFGTV